MVNAFIGELLGALLLAVVLGCIVHIVVNVFGVGRKQKGDTTSVPLSSHTNYAAATGASKATILIFIATFAYLVIFSGTSPGFIGGTAFVIVGIFAVSLLISMPLFLLRCKFPLLGLLTDIGNFAITIFVTHLAYLWLFAASPAFVTEPTQAQPWQPVPQQPQPTRQSPQDIFAAPPEFVTESAQPQPQQPVPQQPQSMQQSPQGYNRYCNARYGFCVSYPNHVGMAPPPENGDGKIFYDHDGLVMTVSGANNSLDNTLQTEMQSKSEDFDNITYRAKGKNWFVLSGYSSDNIIYLKTFVGNRSINRLIIKYPARLRAEHYEMVEEIARSFKPGNLEDSH